MAATVLQCQNWWRFGWERPVWRNAVRGLSRFITTPETSKHRVFIFLPATVLPDNMLTNIALEDAFFLGVLSSKFHVQWALSGGARLEDRPRYTKSQCFDPYPFPGCATDQREPVRRLSESLDAHRKRQQFVHPDLTITDMYNVLEKLRRGEELTAKDKVIHEHGLVSVLRQIHDELDAAVAEAYGWPADLGDEEILRRLVALNAERAEEESRGIVRWLRPEFQNPAGTTAAQGTLALPAETKPAKAKAAAKPSFPKPLAEQARAVRAALQSRGKPVTAAELARTFKGAKADKVQELLETLASLGQARTVEDGRFAA